MKFLVVSTAVTDDVLFPDGTVKKQLAGGAGIYALAGIKIWTDDVAIVTGVGKDYFSLPGDWFLKNNLSRSGLTIKGEFTPRTTIRYFENGGREETPVYGLEHYKMMEPTPEDVERQCGDTEGVYVFKDANKEFWNKIIHLKEKYGFTLMWEIAADTTLPEYFDDIVAIGKHIDVFSINKQEAINLCSSYQIDEVIQKIQALNIPLVFLRTGKEGACMISQEKVYELPSIIQAKVIDVTGGGNSSSGAVLYGYCEDKGLVMSGIMGSISAAYCIAQFGPPPLIDDEMRSNAYLMAEKEYKNYQKADQ